MSLRLIEANPNLKSTQTTMRYKGEFTNGEPHGKGMLSRFDTQYNLIAKYVGAFERGAINGRAKVFMRQEDGRVIEKDYIFKDNVVIHDIGDGAL